jgi:hypothetical protein
MLEPKEIELDDRKYIIHKFPAWHGVHLVGKIPLAVDFTHPDEELRQKVWAEVFSYIAVPIASSKSTIKATPLFLTTQALIDNHVKGWPQMLKLMKIIAEYNDGFLENGSL